MPRCWPASTSRRGRKPIPASYCPKKSPPAISPFRLRQWRGALATDTSRIRILPDLGFAQAGPQRDIKLAETYADELYCLYLLRAAQGQGHGRALLASVRRPAAMTALVLAGNTRACTFDAATGAMIIDTLPCRIGQTETTEHVFAWSGH